MTRLADDARAVLAANDRGGWTRPSPRLYPHQWSWDAGFVAMGWARIDPVRAVGELTHLFRGQWATGMVPQIVFDPGVPDGAYEPGPDAWRTEGHAPAGVATSGICQPPIHALALHRVRAAALGTPALAAVDAAISDLYPRLAAWHRWLRTERDPSGSGLVTILHPWESGLDNSPRWDRALTAVDPGSAEDPLPRPDLTHVAHPTQRPTDGEYRRYRHLVDRLVAVDYDQAAALATHPFRMVDVWLSAILAAADDALADLAVIAGRPDAAGGHRADADRTRRALEGRWDPELGLCTDLDAITGESGAVATVAGFAPLVAGCAPDRAAILVEQLVGPSFAGHPALAAPLPPSTSPGDPAFDPQGYWRGPQWPPITWLLWDGLRRLGHRRTAAGLRAAALAQLEAVGCCEYVHATTGEALGSPSQSWTAAVALDWLASEG